MARAAAKRKPIAKPAPRRRHSGSGAGLEHTLFFSRLRRNAKWVFMALALVFAGGFVFFGVGSGSTGIGDLLRGNFGIFGSSHSSSSTPSIDAARKKVAQNPKGAAAHLQLARALEIARHDDEAIAELEAYTTLKPKDADALRELSGLYLQRAQVRSAEAQAAALDAQSAQPLAFGPASNSKIGQALGVNTDPITQAVVTAANTRYNDAVFALQDTFRQIENIDKRIVAVEPTDSPSVLTLAQDAQRARDVTTAIAAYKRFIKLAPDDPSALLAKQQIKQLSSQLQPTPSR